jgi:hypothetical protein
MRCVSVSLVVASLFVAAAGHAQDERIVAFCDTLFACGWEPDAAVCVDNAVTSDDNARGVNDPICDEYADLELSWMGCMAELDCEDLDGGCSRQDGMRNELEWQGATACGNGDAPAPPPDDWACDPGNFNAGDGCDCGCGSADWDCGNAGCADGSCDAEGCGFCHDDDGDEMDCGGVPANDGPDEPGTGGSGDGPGGPADTAGAANAVGCANQTGATLSPVVGLAFAFLALRRRRR